MYIKVYTKSPLILLRNVNHLLGKYTIPLEVLKTVERILGDEKTGIRIVSNWKGERAKYMFCIQ